MNPEHLLTHFDRIVNTPEAIPRLRRFILDLAVRGKLVEQDPEDEPAFGLLEKIEIEQKSHTKISKTGKLKLFPPIDSEKAPFDLPDSWVWLPLGKTGKIFTGNSINNTIRERLEKTTSGYPFIATKDIGYGFEPIDYNNGLRVPIEDKTFKLARAQSVLICAEGGSAGRKIALTDREICFGNKLLVNETWSTVSPQYVMLVYLSSFFYERFADQMTGIIGGISVGKFLQLPLPLPPLAEQHRIVAKVDELMGLCDQIETARKKREDIRDRLRAASLARLNVPDPDPAVFQSHAAFALNNLTPLTTRPDHIKALRQTILNLAVQGKLVGQESSEGGVDDLLEEFNIQQNRLIAEKKLKHSVVTCKLEFRKNLASIPNSWRWVPLGKLISFGPQNGISPKATNSTGAPRAITLTATTSGSFDASYFKHVEADIPADSEYWLRDGDLLFQRGNTREHVGIAAYFSGASGAAFLYPDLIMKVRLLDGLYLPYVHLALISQSARAYFSTHATGAQATMPKINQQTLLNAPVPLPPLAEQHHIVAKIDKLMALCDRLEASVVTDDETRGRLVEAVLHNALKPDGGIRRELAH